MDDNYQRYLNELQQKGSHGKPNKGNRHKPVRHTPVPQFLSPQQQLNEIRSYFKQHHGFDRRHLGYLKNEPVQALLTLNDFRLMRNWDWYDEQGHNLAGVTRQAAKLGIPGAQYKLATFCEKGYYFTGKTGVVTLVTRNGDEAYHWYKKALANKTWVSRNNNDKIEEALNFIKRYTYSNRWKMFEGDEELLSVLKDLPFFMAKATLANIFIEASNNLIRRGDKVIREHSAEIKQYLAEARKNLEAARKLPHPEKEREISNLENYISAHPLAMLEKARQYYDRGDTYEACCIWMSQHCWPFMTFDEVFRCAFLFYQEKRFMNLDKAQEMFRYCTYLNDKHADSYLFLGIIEKQRGETFSAIQDLSRARDLGSPTADSHLRDLR